MTTESYTANPRPLDAALGYRNPKIVSNFAPRYGVPIAYAAELFEETKKWLWLCALTNNRPSAPEMMIYPHLAALDEMWHTFILHTRDYQSFCLDFLGEFVHHNPTSEEDKEDFRQRVRQGEKSVEIEAETELRRQLDLVVEVFGPATAVKWYGEEESLSLRQLKREQLSLYASRGGQIEQLQAMEVR